ncbi:MAG: methyltransferase [Pseudomonadota bacterium]
MTLNTENRKKRIAHNFGSKAFQYEAYAKVQRHVSEKLASYMPDTMPEQILEIGCGTGLLSAQVLKKYPKSKFVITDLSSQMLNTSIQKFGPHNRLNYYVCDGENIKSHPEISQRKFDLIVSSMTFQWFQNPILSLNGISELLQNDGHIYYATLGQNSFLEWNDTLAKCKRQSGTLDIPEFPNIFAEEEIKVTYDSTYHFLRALKSIGANQPRQGYTPLSPSDLHKAITICDDMHSGQITWHIVYGCITK